jgi:hypothetical protein
MTLIDCRVAGCTGLTFDSLGVCPACRTKILRGEAVALPAPDPEQDRETIKGVGILIAVAVATLTVVGGGQLAALTGRAF